MIRLRNVLYSASIIWLIILIVNSKWISSCGLIRTCIVDGVFGLAVLLVPLAVVMVIASVLKVGLPVLSLLACAIVPVFFVRYSISGDANASLIIVVTPFYVLFFAAFAFVLDYVMDRLLFK